MNNKIITVLTFMTLIISSVAASASEALRYNPFEQPDASEGLQTTSNLANELKLRGTVIDGVNSLVNINGKFYRFNQEVAGYRIVRIARKSVTLRRGTTDAVLLLNDKE